MMLDCENDEFEVIENLENKVTTKSKFDGKIIEFSDVRFVMNACNEASS